MASPTDKLSHSVIVCIHNGFDDVMRCLASLEEHWDSEGLDQLLLIDDCSEAETANAVSTFANNFAPARYIRLDEQHFYTRAANCGLHLSNADISTLLNSDTIVSAGWAKRIRQIFAIDPNVGIVGPLSNAASTQSVPNVKSANGQTAINTLPDDISVNRFAKVIAHLAGGKVVPYVPVVHGFCYSIHRKVIDTIGYLDEEAFPTGYGEENDYSFRCEDAGFALAIALDSFVYHAKSKSYQPEQQQNFTQAGARALADKYSARRIENAIATMENHPSLVAMRNDVKNFWPDHGWLPTSTDHAAE